MQSMRGKQYGFVNLHDDDPQDHWLPGVTIEAHNHQLLAWIPRHYCAIANHGEE
jgi:hypothetical protein